jgi:PPOX class probable F420-dependent enzyme
MRQRKDRSFANGNEPVTLTFNEPMRTFLDEVMPVSVGTIRRDGTVQMNPVWYERRDDEIWLNAASSRAWGKRLRPGAAVTLLFVDPNDQFRWAQVQGRVIEKTADDGEAHIDRLSQRYLGRPYSDHRQNDPRLIIRVEPTAINGSLQRLAA